jgi:predicted nuclease of predicted toxin-antitoxin system
MARSKINIAFLIDENIGSLPAGMLSLAGERIRTVQSLDLVGEDDPVIVAKASELGYVLITSDRRMLADETTMKTALQYNTRIVFLSNKYADANRFDRILWLMRHWKSLHKAVTTSRYQLLSVDYHGRCRKAIPKQSPQIVSEHPHKQSTKPPVPQSNQLELFLDF